MADNIVIGKSLRVNGARPLDYLYGPYESIEALKKSIPIILRYKGLTGAVLDLESGRVTEYWFKSGVSNDDLVEKFPSVESSQADWLEENENAPSYIRNKPEIPEVLVNADWEAVEGVATILNKPDLSLYATKEYVDSHLGPSGPTSWENITDKPDFSDVAFTGDYNDLVNTPDDLTEPSNATITITLGGVVKGSFTLNLNEPSTIALALGESGEGVGSIKVLNTNNSEIQNPQSAEEIAGEGEIKLHKISKTGKLVDLSLNGITDDFKNNLQEELGYLTEETNDGIEELSSTVDSLAERINNLYNSMSNCTVTLSPSVAYVNRLTTVRFTITGQLVPDRIVIRQGSETNTPIFNVIPLELTWTGTTIITPSNTTPILYYITITVDGKEKPVNKTLQVLNDSISRITWNGNVNNGNSVLVGNTVSVNKGTVTVYYISGTTETISSGFTLSVNNGALLNNDTLYLAPTSSGMVTFTANYNGFTDSKTLSIITENVTPTPTTKTVYYGFAFDPLSNVTGLLSKQVTSLAGTYTSTISYNYVLYYIVIPQEMELPADSVTSGGFVVPMSQFGTMTVNGNIYKVYKTTGSDVGYVLDDDGLNTYNFKITL